jgi:hypothetical protein
MNQKRREFLGSGAGSSKRPYDDPAGLRQVAADRVPTYSLRSPLLSSVLAFVASAASGR